MAKKDSIKQIAKNVTSSSSGSSGNSSAIGDGVEFLTLFKDIWNNFLGHATPKNQLIDIFLVALVAMGIIQFVFAVIFGDFPFNAFLAGFISTVGQFVLTVSLRLQSNPQNDKVFTAVSPERAISDYIFASLLLHFIVFHFIN